MEKSVTLEEALKRIEDLEKENAELREKLEYYRNRKLSGRQKHNAKWMAIYNDFVVGYESGMTMVEIAKRNNVSERTIYRYKAYYDKMRNVEESIVYGEDKRKEEIATDLFGGRMEETKELITKDDICSKVYIIRGQQVMLDKDLAEIYGYEVKKLNQQVKRNIERFPEDFMFRLSNSEIDSVRSQIVTSRKKDFFAGQEGGRRYLPYAFTEQGIYMLATVLRGELAEQQSIFIMRTFREMRHYIRQNQQFVTRNEMNFLTAKVGTITERQDRMENKVDSIQKDLAILADNFITDKDKKNFVIYKGQKFEADIAYIEIYQQAKKSIYVVDDYMNAKSLQHLSQKADGVEVVLFTENGKGGKGFLTKSLVTDFQNEYTSLRIKPNPDCHDRLIVLDYGEETELVYHCGASSKDAGKKLCAINQITETAIIHPVIDRLLLLPDKEICW